MRLFHRKEKKTVRSPNIRLYHGSTNLFSEPKVKMNKGPCDFGHGFYATEDYKRAYERAIETMTEQESDSGYVMEFILEDEAIPPDKFRILHFRKDAEWLRFVRDNRNGIETVDFDIAIGPSADGVVEDILTKLDRRGFIGFDDVSNLVQKLADNHYGEQYCFRNQDLVNRFIKPGRVSRIGTGMTAIDPDMVSEYALGAFAEAHGMSVSEARGFLEGFGTFDYLGRSYKAYAHMMAPQMVSSLRQYVERHGGVCPPMVLTDI